MSNLITRYQRWTPYLLSILRFMVAALFLEHGSQKILGFPPAMPQAHAGGPHPQLPMWLMMLLVSASAWLELIGGALLVIGLAVRPTAFVLAGEMAVAYFAFHAIGGFFPANNGGELSIVYCFVFLFLSAAGGGPWSLDALLFAARSAGGKQNTNSIIS